MKNKSNSQSFGRSLAILFLCGQFLFIVVSLAIIIGSEAAAFEVKAALAFLSALMIPAMHKTSKFL